MRRALPALVLVVAACGSGPARHPPAGPADVPLTLGAPTWPTGSPPTSQGAARALPPLSGEGGAAGGSGGGGGTGGDGAAGQGGGGPVDLVLTDVGAPLGGDHWGTKSSTYMGMGGGVALVDLDGDGDLDLLFSAELNPLTAFRNDGGLHFVEATDAFGLGGIWHSTAFALGDCDGDGQLEILVSRAERNLLLARGEDGRWHEVPGAGLGDVPQHGLSAEFRDLDGDGDLDVFQAVYLPDSGFLDGEVPHVYFGDGTCHFQRQGPLGLNHGLGVDFALFDADDDGDPDVLISNDFGMVHGPVAFEENLGGTFRRVPGIDGLLYGMGATVADLDHDGRLDVYVANIARNPWYRNEGPLQLVDRSEAYGIGDVWYVDLLDEPDSFPVLDINSSDPVERKLARFNRDYVTPRPDDEHSFIATTWSANAVDLDADGWLDLFLADGQSGAPNLPEGLHQRLHLYQQTARGRFRDVSAAVGFDFRGTFKGSTVGDLDGDGLPDLLVFDHLYGNLAPQHRVLHNESSAGNWVRVKLAGRAPNTWGLGAVVRVDLPDHPVVQQRSLHDGVYSASADSMFFGVGAATRVDVQVTWPWKGGTTVVRDVDAGSTVTVVQP